MTKPTPLQAEQIALKVFLAQDSAPVQLELLLPIFHRWIQQNATPEMLIDVADYRHVPHGPGVMLVCHEAHYSFDQAEPGPGLRYVRKRAGNGTFNEKLSRIFRSLLEAAKRLEEEETLRGSKFRSDELLFQVQDQLLAPNNEETRLVLQPELERFLRSLYAEGSLKTEHTTANDPRAPFSLHVTSSEKADLSLLLSRLPTAS